MLVCECEVRAVSTGTGSVVMVKLRGKQAAVARRGPGR